MTIVKWTVSPFNSPPSRQEYSHETAKFYMHARGRGRDAKDSSWLRYFDSEAEALEFIRQRNENKVEQKRVDRIKECGLELLASLEECLPCLGWEHDSDEEIQREHELGNGYAELILRARAAIAKAKGEA